MVDKCVVCGRETKTRGYCKRHYFQMWKYGEIRDTRSIGIFDKNEIVIKGHIIEIILCDINCNEVGRALIDTEDLEKVKGYKWRKSKLNYATTGSSNLKMHRFIMECSTGEDIDHINGNGLDNRKVNLRVCTHQENMRNAKIQCNNKSGYKGVSFNAKRQKWESCITVNRKTIHLGIFKEKEDAIKARQLAEENIFKEFSYYNRENVEL